MNTNALEILKCGRQAASEKAVCDEALIPFQLELFGVHLDLCVACRNETITLKDIVRPARQLCDIVIQLAVEHQRLCGKPVTCSSGCMACCKYMVTVSPAEAIAISDMINNLPRQSRQTLLRNMTMAGRKIISSCPSTIKTCNLEEAHSSSRLVELSRWYAAINLTCPWIENKLCSRYPNRPLVCREFMVTSPPAQCTPNAPHERTIVDLPIKMSEVLMAFCAKLTNTKPQAMLLPLVSAWCEDFTELQHKQFDAKNAAAVLIDMIHEHCRQTTPYAMVIQ